MWTLIGCFLGCFLGTFVAYLLIGELKKAEPDEELTREAPKNISSISDPLSRYEKYADKNSRLYKPIKNKVVNRVEIGSDEDSK